MKNIFQAVRSGLRRYWNRLVVSSTSQAVSSLTNFGIALFLVRELEKEQYGLYGLGFSLTLIIVGLVTSSICVQFVVNLPDQSNDQRISYAMHHMGCVVLVGLVLMMIAALICFISFRSTIHGLTILRELSLPVTSAAAIHSVRDFMTRMAYSERREVAVLVSNISVALSVAAGLFGVLQTGIELTAGICLYVYALGQMFGCLFGLRVYALPWRHFSFGKMRLAFVESWRGGRWSVMTSLTYNLRTQAHNIVLPPLLGVSALADVNAARVLVTPAVMAIPAFTQVLLPRLAEQRGQGASKLFRTAGMAIGGLFAVALLYSAVLITCLPWLLPLALGVAYSGIGALVVAWCIVTAFLAMRNGLSITLQVLRAFRDLMLANLAAALLAIAAALLLVKTLGGLGAILALALAELMLCLVLILILRKRIQAEAVTKRT
ncbi:MAG: hypothetical protein V5B36_18165 [Candidatus Accumulibacter sp. UW25]|jgi:O-antigen/teichoic acid export membrane protein